MGTVSLTNTVNISISATSSGLGEFSTNSIYLLTNEKPLSVNPYIYAVNAQDIINEYGSNSKTAAMATALFTPSQNLRTGSGQVLVFPYTATDATAATLTTEAIDATKIAAFQLVSNGQLSIEIDGADYSASNLNFSAIEDVDDIVTVLEAIGLDCNISVVDANKIQFQSRMYGTSSGVSIKEITGATGVDLYGANYLNGATATTVAGTNVTGTTLSEAYAQASEIGYCGGVITSQISDNDAIVANATNFQDNDVVYYETIESLRNIATLGQQIQSASLTKTRLSAYSMSGSTGTRRFVATYATIAQSSNYSGTNTALTMNLKTATGMVADTNLSDTYYTLAKQYGVDIYASTEGLSVIYSFDNGYYTDDACNLLWLKKALEVSGFNYLRQTNSKIPQTPSGLAGLKNAYETRCIQGVRNGVIGTGLSWNGSIPFGDPEDFARNIEEKGYYIYSIPISEQAQSEREARQAPLIQIAIKLSGSINSSSVIIQVER